MKIVRWFQGVGAEKLTIAHPHSINIKKFHWHKLLTRVVLVNVATASTREVFHPETFLKIASGLLSNFRRESKLLWILNIVKFFATL